VLNGPTKHALLRKESNAWGRPLVVAVSRDELLESLMTDLTEGDSGRLRHPIIVKFRGETAQDKGGPTREYFVSLATLLFKEPGLFRKANGDQFCWFAQNEDIDHCELRKMFAAGLLLRLALSNAVTLPVRFPSAPFKKLKKEPLTVLDLQEIDGDLGRSLLEWRNDYLADGADYKLIFAVNGRGNEVIPLVKGGENRRVTAENFDEYLRAIVEYHLTTAVSVAFGAFADGFSRVPETRVMRRLTARDLDLLLTGTDVEDWSELKQTVTYKNYSKESPAVALFWKIFDDLSSGEKAKMLQFVTGSSRAPVGGVKRMNIVIEIRGG
jgi:hypothetical protein